MWHRGARTWFYQGDLVRPDRLTWNPKRVRIRKKSNGQGVSERAPIVAKQRPYRGDTIPAWKRADTVGSLGNVAGAWVYEINVEEKGS